MNYQITFSHVHVCTDCHEAFECFCSEPHTAKRCADCFMQLRLLEFND